jgi:Arc/MetJ-type ribon-helix-helix transcriptional regulator
MTLTLRREVQEFIDQQIGQGRFANAEELVEAAIEQFRQPQVTLTAEDIAAIKRADEQARRVEGTEIDAFRHRIGRHVTE